MAVAAPAAPAAPDIAGEMAAASADYEAKRAPLAAELAAKVAPAQDAAIQSAEELSKLAEQKPALAPLPKNMAQHIDPKVMSDTAQIFMTMGALFGLASRQPMTAVLGNMTAAMKGVQAGDAAQYDKAMEEYKTNFDAAMKTNKAMLDEQRRALENKNMSLSARLQEMKIIEAKYGGPLRGVDESFKRTMEMYKARGKAITDAERAHAVALKADAAVAKARHGGAGGAGGAAGAGGPLKPETVDFYARQSLSGDNSWQVGLARGKVGQQLIAAVKDRIPQLAAESGMTPQDAMTMKSKRDALAGTMKQRQQFLGAAQQFIRQFKTQADLVEKYLDPGAAGSIPVFNKWIQVGRKATGDPDVVAFDTAIRGLAREHQRIVTGVTSNAQLHVSAQNTADELINRAMTPSQIRSTLGVMREEADNAIDAGKQEVEFATEQMRHLGPQSAKAAPPGVRTATNPKTGEKLMLQDGKWVPLK